MRNWTEAGKLVIAVVLCFCTLISYSQSKLETAESTLKSLEDDIKTQLDRAAEFKLAESDKKEKEDLVSLTRHYNKVKKKRLLIGGLLLNQDLPDDGKVKKLKKYLAKLEKFDGLKKMNLNLVNYNAFGDFAPLSMTSIEGIKDVKEKKKLIKANKLLAKARGSSKVKNLNVAVVPVDSIKEIRTELTKFEDFLFDYEFEYKRMVEEEKRRIEAEKKLAAELYLKGFIEEVKGLLWEDLDREYEKLLAQIKKMELIELRVDVFNGYVSNLSFGTGKSQILTVGKEELSNFFRTKLIQKLQERTEAKGGDSKHIIRIIVNGYADAQPFYAKQPIAERKDKNQKLSQKRADMVKQFIEEEFQSTLKQFNGTIWVVTSIGLGEEFPPGVDPNDKRINNPDRRIVTYNGTIE